MQDNSLTIDGLAMTGETTGRRQARASRPTLKVQEMVRLAM